MKLLFAKYIPVEGEIKGGDKIINPFGRIETVKSVFPNSINAELGNDCSTVEEEMIHLTSRCKKVKLFLCSRDIQVGDKFIIDGEEHTCDTLIDGRVGYKEKGESVLLGDADIPYRKIGEISPEATWVTEGDEFEVEDVGLSYFIKHGSELLPVGLVTDQALFMRNPGATCIAKIKGCCGHFH